MQVQMDAQYRANLQLACSADETSPLRLMERMELLRCERSRPAAVLDAFVRDVYGFPGFKQFALYVLQDIQTWAEKLRGLLRTEDQRMPQHHTRAAAKFSTVQGRLAPDGIAFSQKYDEYMQTLSRPPFTAANPPGMRSWQEDCGRAHDNLVNLDKWSHSIKQQIELLDSIESSAVVGAILQISLVAVVKLACLCEEEKACLSGPDHEDKEAKTFYESAAVPRKASPVLKSTFYRGLCNKLIGFGGNAAADKGAFSKIAASCFLLWVRMELGEIEACVGGKRLKREVFGEHAPQSTVTDAVLNGLFAFNGDVLQPQWERAVFGMHGPFPSGAVPPHLQGVGASPLCGMLTPPCMTSIVCDLMLGESGIAGDFGLDAANPVVRASLQGHCAILPAIMCRFAFELQPSVMIGIVLLLVMEDLKIHRHTTQDRGPRAIAFANALIFPATLSDAHARKIRSEIVDWCRKSFACEETQAEQVVEPLGSEAETPEKQFKKARLA